MHSTHFLGKFVRKVYSELGYFCTVRFTQNFSRYTQRAPLWRYTQRAPPRIQQIIPYPRIKSVVPQFQTLSRLCQHFCYFNTRPQQDWKGSSVMYLTYSLGSFVRKVYLEHRHIYTLHNFGRGNKVHPQYTSQPYFQDLGEESRPWYPKFILCKGFVVISVTSIRDPSSSTNFLRDFVRQVYQETG